MLDVFIDNIFGTFNLENEFFNKLEFQWEPIVALFLAILFCYFEADIIQELLRKEMKRIWYIILQFVNICGVISNGFLIGFTSSWGQSYGVYTRLWIVVGFEHIVFVLKLIIDYLIPDVPSVVRLMATKHMHDMSITLMNDRGKLENNYNEDFTNGTKYHQSKDNTSLKIPAINRKEETEMKIVDEKRVLRSSSTQKRTYKAYKENRYQKIDTSSTHTSKKRNKKKKHQHPQQDRVDDNIEHPSLVQKLNHQSDALYYTTRDQDRRISFKVKGPRNYINAERPIITTIKKLGDSRHASPNADDSKA